MTSAFVHLLIKSEDLLFAVQRMLLMAVTLSLPSLMVAVIVMRYWLEIPFLGIEEIAVLLGLWLHFLGAACATREGKHITGGVVELVISSPRKRSAVKFAASLITFSVCCTIFYFSLDYGKFMIETNRKSIYLGWPSILWAGSMMIGFALMLFYFLLQTIRDWRNIWQAPDPRD